MHYADTPPVVRRHDDDEAHWKSRKGDPPDPIDQGGDPVSARARAKYLCIRMSHGTWIAIGNPFKWWVLVGVRVMAAESMITDTGLCHPPT